LTFLHPSAKRRSRGEKGDVEMPYQSQALTQPDFPNQRGSTCGLYALEGVLRALDPGTKYRATKDHASGNQDVISLREIAKNKLGITVIGELFHASDLMALAKFVGLKSALHTNANWKDVIATAIGSGRYVIAPFGVDTATGEPQTSGDCAHWCVIFGYAFWLGPAPTTSVAMPFLPGSLWTPPQPQDPPSYAIVRHWGRNFCFLMEQFMKSSQALKNFPKQSWQKQSGSKNLSYAKVNPSGPSQRGAREIPEADLPKTLADKLVVVGKG
jgi:hypothetical protein